MFGKINIRNEAFNDTVLLQFFQLLSAKVLREEFQLKYFNHSYKNRP